MLGDDLFQRRALRRDRLPAGQAEHHARHRIFVEGAFVGGICIVGTAGDGEHDLVVPAEVVEAGQVPGGDADLGQCGLRSLASRGRGRIAEGHGPAAQVGQGPIARVVGDDNQSREIFAALAGLRRRQVQGPSATVRCPPP